MHTHTGSPQSIPTSQVSTADILQNIIVGVTVSFIALSLGAALGILSGRGAFSGMISAGLIACATSLLGGTRVQCSGPTAPMSAVSAVVVAYAVEQPLAMQAHQFVNLVFLMCGLLLILMATLRLGRYIALVPNVVISGFMSGIALLIWIDQIDSLMGWAGRPPLSGPRLANLVIAGGTLTLIFLFAPLTRMAVGRMARFLPSTLMAIVIMTGFSHLMHFPIEYVTLKGGLASLGDLGRLIRDQVPTGLSGETLLLALPFALQLSLLCYLDTLLTSLVIDKLNGEQTRRNKELLAQGVGNGLVAFVGGIPGAQATIRSVLMLKEQATLRLSGVVVGIFVLIEMVLFQDWINLIPKAVFVGVLIKVGYDVFDFKPLRLYCKQFAQHRSTMLRQFFARHDDQQVFVTNREMLMILGTTAVTVWLNLNVAVAAFTLLFYLHNSWLNRANPMRDLKPELETDAFAKQN